MKLNANLSWNWLIGSCKEEKMCKICRQLLIKLIGVTFLNPLPVIKKIKSKKVC